MKSLSVVVAVLIASAFPAPGATAASALPCDGGNVCVWTESGYGGERIFQRVNPWNWCIDTYPGAYSGVNYGQYDVTLSEGECGNPGRGFYLRAGESRDSFPHVVRSVSHCRNC